jgi:hypothetical protein
VLVMRIKKSRIQRSQIKGEKLAHFVLQIKISARAAYEIEAILKEEPVSAHSAAIPLQDHEKSRHHAEN